MSRSLKPYDYVLYFTIIGVKLYIFESFVLLHAGTSQTQSKKVPWSPRGVFYFFPGPEHKKPESPGKAKKDYLPTSKRHVVNRFPGGLAVILNGCSSSRPGFDSRPCRTTNVWRKKEKRLFFHGKKKRILAPNDDLTTYLPRVQGRPSKKNRHVWSQSSNVGARTLFIQTLACISNTCT